MSTIEFTADGKHGTVTIDGVVIPYVTAIDVSMSAGHRPCVAVTISVVGSIATLLRQADTYAQVDTAGLDQAMPEDFQRALFVYLRDKFEGDMYDGNLFTTEEKP